MEKNTKGILSAKSHALKETFSTFSLSLFTKRKKSMKEMKKIFLSFLHKIRNIKKHETALRMDFLFVFLCAYKDIENILRIFFYFGLKKVFVVNFFVL